MSRKGILILILVALAIGVTVFWFATPKTTIFENPAEEQTGFSPLGSGNPSTGETENNQTPVFSNNTTADSISALTVKGRLTKISSEAVAGFTTFTKQVPVEVEESALESTIELYDFTKYPTLRLGDVGEGVLALKIVLNRGETSPGLTETTDFDVATNNAVIAFQQANNLQPDGVVGPGTKRALNAFQGFVEKEPEAQEYEVFDVVRYLKRADGIVFDFSQKDSSVTKITETIIPRVYSAQWNNNADAVVLQLLDTLGSTVRTFKGSLEDQPEKTLQRLSGEFLPDNIGFITVSPVKNEFFYLMKNGEYTKGIVENFKSDTKKTIFSSAFSEWLPQWTNEKTINLTTLSSGFAQGYSLALATDNQKINELLGNILGLTTNTNPQGTKILYNQSNNQTNNPDLYLYDIATSTSQNLGLSTLPEKCSWHPSNQDIVLCGVPTFFPNGTYPDDWYQGRVVLGDNIWVINLSTLQTNQIINIGQEAQTQIDILEPQISNTGEFFVFKNKTDLSLWQAKIPKF